MENQNNFLVALANECEASGTEFGKGRAFGIREVIQGTYVSELKTKIRDLQGEVDMYKGALEMTQPADEFQKQCGMGAMPPEIQPEKE